MGLFRFERGCTSSPAAEGTNQQPTTGATGSAKEGRKTKPPLSEYNLQRKTKPPLSENNFPLQDEAATV
jgi:hypothetical protein